MNRASPCGTTRCAVTNDFDVRTARGLTELVARLCVWFRKGPRHPRHSTALRGGLAFVCRWGPRRKGRNRRSSPVDRDRNVMASGVVCPGEENRRSSRHSVDSIRRDHQCRPLHEGRLRESDGADIPGPEGWPASTPVSRSLQTRDRGELCRSSLRPSERHLDLQGCLVDLESLLTRGAATRIATPPWRSDPNGESVARPQATSPASRACSSGSSNRIRRDSNSDEGSKHRPPTRWTSGTRRRSRRSGRSRIEDRGSHGDHPVFQGCQSRFEARRGGSRRRILQHRALAICGSRE